MFIDGVSMSMVNFVDWQGASWGREFFPFLFLTFVTLCIKHVYFGRAILARHH